MKTINCVMIGDRCVGKTSLVHKYLTKSFAEVVSVPTSVKEHKKEVTVDLKKYEMRISDTGAEDWIRSWRFLLYSKADVICICFSLVNLESFHNVSLRWCPEVRKCFPSVPIILVGTKLDYRTTGLRRIVPLTYSQGMELANEIGAVRYWECSARQDEGVDTVFNDAVRVACFPRTFFDKNGDKYEHTECVLN